MAVEDKRVFRVRVRGRGSTLNSELGVEATDARRSLGITNHRGINRLISTDTTDDFGKCAVASLGLFCRL